MLTAIETLLGGALSFFYDLIPSLGLAIILLTVAVNIVLFPLTLKQTRSTRAFQTIQPEIKRIQKELKSEPEQMQKELMRVQREAGATPGGCLLPMIIQFPIWIALFRVLREIANVATGAADTTALLPSQSKLLAAVQAGNTHFLGMDLGRLMKDGLTGTTVVAAIPYAMLIIIMVASQYYQQWHATKGTNAPTSEMTPQQRQQQQTQQVLTRIMPLFIGFISLNFPAGLAIYWATGNVFRLGQQFAIFAIDGRPPHPGSAAAGESKPEGSKSGSPNGSDASVKPERPHPVSDKKRRRRRK
jgi:YidC/Oxa1 family membrane protein insertase